MKLPAILLVGSLAANATLLATLTLRFSASNSTETAAPSPIAVETVASGADPHAAEVGAWTTLRGSGTGGREDLSAFVRLLREAGFPPMVLRALVEHAVREQFAERRKAIIDAAEKPNEYWSFRFNAFGGIDPKTRSAQRDLAREERLLLRTLLGDDYDAGQDYHLANRRRYFGNLSSEKIEQLQDITSDYFELRAEIAGPTFSVLLPEEREKLAFLEREMRQDIAAVLTPGELEDYELRSSQTTSRLRNALADLDLSDNEFRSIFSLQKAFDDQFQPNPLAGGVYNRTPEFAKHRGEAEKTLVAEIKALLGEPRASEYERARDYAYQALKRVTEQLELPTQTAIDAYTAQKEIQQRAAALRSDRALTAEQRNAQLTQLAQDAAARLSTTLGAQGFEAYKSNGGQWIEQLAPRETPKPTSPGVSPTSTSTMTFTPSS